MNCLPLVCVHVCVYQDKEVAQAGQPPRILALDSYFINEVEKMEKDPITGRRSVFEFFIYSRFISSVHSILYVL